MLLKLPFLQTWIISSLLTLLSAQCPARELCIITPQVNIQDLSYFENQYCGCRRILGSLSISLDGSSPEFSSSDFAFLNNLEEVTNYILFSNVKTSDLILPSLRIIGGRDPFSPSFSNGTYSIFFANCTIDQILLPRLTYIGDHTVGVVENREVTGVTDITRELLSLHTGCNLYGVNWNELFRKLNVIYRTEVGSYMGSPDVIVDLASECNTTQVESSCEQCLGGVCWNASDCQVLTSTFSGVGCIQCNPQSGCYDVAQELCCHDLCLGGCYGPGPDECYGCKGLVNENTCVSTCPPRFRLNSVTFMLEPNPDGRFTLDRFCVPECIGSYIQFEDDCVLTCPDEYTPVVDSGVLKCKFCGSACPIDCNGTNINGKDGALVAAKAHLFENCTRVNGPILINALTYEEGNATDLSYLESITEITGYLTILFSTENVFDFLRNLRVIQGNTLYTSGFSLTLGVNNFEYIDLSALEMIDTGRIFIFSNTNLCYLANLTVFRPESTILQISPSEYPNNPNCSCDYECQPELRCWGPGPTRCVSCRNFIHERTCVRNCSGIPRVFSNSETKTCSPCDPECLNSCTNATRFSCDACVNFKSGGECVNVCPDNHFADATKTCVECNSLCVMGCSGPNITLSSGGCNLCDRIVLDEDDRQVGCVAGDLCPGGYFERTELVSDVIPERNMSDVDIEVCRPCHPLCESCTGPGIENCTSCKYFSNDGVCVETCDADTYAAILECIACNQECVGCTGPGFSDCIECRNVVEEGKCLSACSDGYYEDSNSNCTACNSTCGTCDGAGANSCTSCNAPNFFTLRGVSNGTCTEGCDEGSYESHGNISECLPCPPLCRVCKALDDCTSCHFARLESGGPCVSECPPDFEVDETGVCDSNSTSTLEETLDQYKIPIIGAFIAGISILVCAIISFFVCLLCYFRRSKKKLKLEDELENPTYGLLPADTTPSPARGLEMHTLGSNQTGHSRGRFGSQESLVEADMTQLVIADLTRIEKREVLGKGAFGVVYKGVWLPMEGEPILVAIKELNQDAPIEDMQELIKEAVLLAKMRHQNLVRFYCLCMARQLMIVNELVQGGALLDYLKKEGKHLTPYIRLTFMQQIASGMGYLESRRLIHRDLASRNCLVASNELVKISDFGMSRILDVGEDQYISSGGKIPVRWMPLESIFYKQYSHKSDVWSYGVTVWEILTSAKRPYGNIKPQQVIEQLVSGMRLEQPINCSSKLYDIVKQCWIDKPEDRISFEELVNQLQEMLREPHLYVYEDLEHEVRSMSSESSIVGDYEEIDDEVMAYLVTTQVQIMVRDAINGKRGTLNYENLREGNTQDDPFSAEYSVPTDSTPEEAHPTFSSPNNDENYSMANDIVTQKAEIYSNSESAGDVPASDYMLANDLVTAPNTSQGTSSNSLSVFSNKGADRWRPDSDRTSKTDSGSDYVTNDIYVTDKSPRESLDVKTSKVYPNPYIEAGRGSILGKSTASPNPKRPTPAGYLDTNHELERAPPTEYLDSNPTLERTAPSEYLDYNPISEISTPAGYLESNPTLERTATAGYLDTNPESERAPPTEYLDSNPTLERTATAGYLDTNPDVKRTAPTEYLDSNPTLERTATAGYLDTNPDLKRAAPSEYLDSNPTLERTATAGYLDTNPDVKRAAPSEYLDSNPTLERTATAGYLDTNPDVKRAAPSEYLDSNPTLERTATTGYLESNPTLERTAPTEYLDSNPITEKPTPAGYLDTNPDLNRAAPTEYLNYDPAVEGTNANGNQTKQTVYECLDPDTMILTQSSESTNKSTEYVNQERIDSKKKKDSRSKPVVLDDDAYMEMGENNVIFSPTTSLQTGDNEHPHEYEDINEDTIPVHEYSEADEMDPSNFNGSEMMGQPLPHPGVYSFVGQGNTSGLAQKLNTSEEPHYATSLLQSVSHPNKFPLEEKNPLYGNTRRPK